MTKTLKAENEALTSAHDHIGKEGAIVKKKFTANQEKALAVLVNTPSVAEAAREGGLHRNSLFTYLRIRTLRRSYIAGKPNSSRRARRSSGLA